MPTLYFLDYWETFPDTEYGGLFVGLANSDSECVHLCLRKGTEYADLPYENLTPEICNNIRRQAGAKTYSNLLRSVGDAKRLDFPERRLDGRDGKFYWKERFLDNYGSSEGTKAWENSTVEESGILKSFAT